MVRVFVAFVLAAAVCAIAVSSRKLLVNLALSLGRPPSYSVEVIPPPEAPSAEERAVARERIAGDVIAGRLSLAGAAEELRRADGWHGPQIIRYVPGRTDDEKWRRVVIAWVERIEGRPDDPRSVSRRLWAELDDWLAAQPASGEGR